ncbi:AbrB/MazE/SpoVT family DNA-binding domain-containing protein [Sphingobacterium sp. 1.A.4]|uniref:AbrB/MazE/SpoVT family DNA-binding domain-containing protein n=1 Tax=Sphingobacterium sp. 1.A.4 TaxID=2044603 RepID=UPI0015D4C218|nr:AbrB/MazE/SpoVT family DNA-binding domain-containing protein [Sphingobacterium sp. 1.A.4]
MKTKIIKIGKSFGIIIRKQFLEQLHITDEVFLLIKDSKTIIETVNSKPRKYWEEKLLKANSLKDLGEFEYIDNDFDKTEWSWK